MVRMHLDEFDKVKRYVEEWARERAIEASQIGVHHNELTFFGDTIDGRSEIIGTYWIRDEELELENGDILIDLFDM